MKSKKANIYVALGATTVPTMSGDRHIMAYDKALFKRAYKGISKYAKDTDKYKRITDLDSLKNGTWYYFIAEGAEGSPNIWLADEGFFDTGTRSQKPTIYYYIDIEYGLKDAEVYSGACLFEKHSEVLFCRRANKKEIAAAHGALDKLNGTPDEYDRLFSGNEERCTKEDIKSPEGAVLTSHDDFKDGTWYVITGERGGVESRMLCNGSFYQNTGKHHHIDLDTFEVFTSDSKYMPSLMFVSGREASYWEIVAAESLIKEVDLLRRYMMNALAVAEGSTSLKEVLKDIVKDIVSKR